MRMAASCPDLENAEAAFELAKGTPMPTDHAAPTNAELVEGLEITAYDCGWGIGDGDCGLRPINENRMAAARDALLARLAAYEAVCGAARAYLRESQGPTHLIRLSESEAALGAALAALDGAQGDRMNEKIVSVCFNDDNAEGTVSLYRAGDGVRIAINAEWKDGRAIVQSATLNAAMTGVIRDELNHLLAPAPAPETVTDDWVMVRLDREHAEWLADEIGPKNWVGDPPTQAQVVSKVLAAALIAPALDGGNRMNRASNEHCWTFFSEYRGSDSSDTFDYCETCGVIRARHVWKGGHNDPTYCGPGVEMGTTNQPVCLALLAPAPAPETVSDERVDAAAEAIWSSILGPGSNVPWDRQPRDMQARYRIAGRAALGAALGAGDEGEKNG